MLKPNFLYEGHKCGKVQELPLAIREPDIEMLKADMSTTGLRKIEEVSSVKIHSATFTPGKSIILIKSTGVLPKFARVLKIYRLDGKFGFVCLSFKTISMDKELHAYVVIPTTLKAFIDVEKLAFQHEIISLKTERKLILIPQCHRALLT